MTRFLFSSRSDVLFLHVCRSKKRHRRNSIAGTSERGNRKLPLHGTAGSHIKNSCVKPLEPFVTMTMNCWFPEIELMLSNLGTVGSPFQTTAISRRWNLRAPTYEPYVTIVRNRRFPKVGTHSAQLGDHTLPL